MPKQHVFVSYVRADAELLGFVRDAVRATGMEFVDSRNLRGPGIETAIRDAALFVACFSANAEGTATYVRDELEFAIAEVRSMRRDAAWLVPVKLTQCEVPSLPILTVADRVDPKVGAGGPITLHVAVPAGDLHNLIGADNVHAHDVEVLALDGERSSTAGSEKNEARFGTVISDGKAVFVAHRNVK
jgi:hypothetical protein